MFIKANETTRIGSRTLLNRSTRSLSWPLKLEQLFSSNGIQTPPTAHVLVAMVSLLSGQVDVEVLPPRVSGQYRVTPLSVEIISASQNPVAEDITQLYTECLHVS